MVLWNLHQTIFEVNSQLIKKYDISVHRMHSMSFYKRAPWPRVSQSSNDQRKRNHHSCNTVTWRLNYILCTCGKLDKRLRWRRMDGSIRGVLQYSHEAMIPSTTCLEIPAMASSCMCWRTCSREKSISVGLVVMLRSLLVLERVFFSVFLNGGSWSVKTFLCVPDFNGEGSPSIKVK